MNARSRNLLIIAAVAGLTSGFSIRWLQRGGTPDGQSSGPSASPAVSGVTAPPVAPTRQGKHLTPVAAKLEEELAVSSGVMRWLVWMTAMEKATVADFPHMARMAKGNSIALRMVAARWIELNPSHLFETLVATAAENDITAGSQSFPLNELGLPLFEDWSKRDPAAAIAALSRPGFPSSLRDLRFTVLNSVMKNDPELGLKTMADWHIENYGASTDGVAKWAAGNPRHAAEFALAHPAGYTTQNVMDVIGKQWAKTDPEAALTFASGLKDKFGTSLASGIVTEWATKNLAKAAAWLAAADPSVRKRLSGPMVEIWAKTDTAGALDWIQENLTGSGLDEAMGSVLKGAAEKDVTAAAELVSGMDSSMARARAAVAVARKWFPSYGSAQPVPAETITWLSSLDPVSVRHVVDQMQWQWAGSDPKSLSDFLLTPAGQNAPEYAFATTAREMSRRNPAEALEWAGRVPEANRARAAAAVFAEWQNTQPAAATEWLRKLPVTDPRREPFYLASLRDYFPNRQEAALVARDLAAGNTAAVRATIQKLSVPQDIKVKILEKLELK